MSAAQLLRREARRNNDLAKWREAETLARRAFAAAETAELDQDHVKDASILWHETAAERKELEQQLADARADEKMLARLNEVQALKTTIARGRFITEEAIPGYENAFKEYGCDPKANSAVAVARMLQGRAIAPELAAALDDWASLLKPEAEALRTKLRQAARRIDPDPFRTQLRDLLESRSREGLRLLVGAPEALSQPALSQVRLAQAVRAAGDLDLAVTFLRKAQEQRPSDFWLNFYLGLYLLHQNRPDEAARYFTVAVALQPRSPGAWFALGLSLGNQSKHEEAAQAYQRALKLKADYAEALGNLALLHADLGRLDQAIPLIKQVTILDPENPQGHANLGELLSQDGQHEAALAAFKAGLLRSGTNALWAGNLKERIGQTERKLALAKKLPPRGSAALDWKAADLEAAAELCMDLRRFGQAADLCALLPPNRERRLGGPLGEARLLAITAAAKAGTGETRDQPPLADADRKTYRRLALAWLTQDLAKLRTQAQSGTPADAAIAREALRRLQNHFDLAPLRGEPLQKLPEDEQAAWRKFWTDLADLRRQSQD